jgi:endonuclease YncB( thermonuclease family)
MPEKSPAKAIHTSKSGLVVGHVKLGLYGQARGTVAQEVHDGDTIAVQTVGNLGVRFLGIDAAEISYKLPDGKNQFVSIGNDKWEAFLADPFSEWPVNAPTLDQSLKDDFKNKLQAGVAKNHHRHAKNAEKALEKEINKDLKDFDLTAKEVQFFLVFAHDVMDRYGRLLCYISPEQPDIEADQRRPSYNQRLLEQGAVSPYFIWPNTDPFRKQSFREAIFKPGKALDVGSKGALGKARKCIGEARDQKIGIFKSDDPLMLQSFELRFLADRRPPQRWVIDLSKDNDVLVHPQNYFSISNVEDRLFIPDEFVALFTEVGWRTQELIPA